MSMFHDDLEKARYELSEKKRKAHFIKIITLGILNPKKDVDVANHKVQLLQEKTNRYDSLLGQAKVLDDELLMTVEVEGIRVSKNTFADYSRLGADGYPDDWEQLRKMVLSRDNHQCSEICTSCKGPLQIHHITPLSKGGTNEMANLITLCFSHHCQKHPHMKDKYHGNIWR